MIAGRENAILLGMTRPSLQSVLLIAATLALPSAALAHGGGSHGATWPESTGFFAGFAHFFGLGAHWALPIVAGALGGWSGARRPGLALWALTALVAGGHAWFWTAESVAAGMGLALAYGLTHGAAALWARAARRRLTAR